MPRKKSSDPVDTFKGLTKKQDSLIQSIQSKSMTITYGSAGTGKTYVAAVLAAKAFNEGKVKKIIITRPNIPTGKSLGYFPGDLKEKMQPWVAPIMAVLTKHIKDDVELCLKRDKIQIVPFETIRGHTFDNSFVILDEAQNTSVEEIKAFTTRIGEYSTVVISGDTTQTDIKNTDNGLDCIIDMVLNSKALQKHVGLVMFSPNDIVRSGLCKLWVEAFM